ncbi:MAG: hypothetical protein AAFY73_05770 [Pseudomonadota bacterium]
MKKLVITLSESQRDNVDMLVREIEEVEGVKVTGAAGPFIDLEVEGNFNAEQQAGEPVASPLGRLVQSRSLKLSPVSEPQLMEPISPMSRLPMDGKSEGSTD